MKRIVILRADGTEEELDHVPKLKELQAIVGGYIERVRVMDREENGAPVITTMYANEEGLLKRLPRNERATYHYQRLVRWQYPGSDQPFRRHEEELEKLLRDQNIVRIRAPRIAGVAPTYDDDPYIVGDVVLFEGYTEHGVDKLYGDD